MNQNQLVLEDYVMQEFPLQFIEGIVQRKDFVDGEARTKAFDETAWDSPESEYILGHLRRCLFEKMFRQEAINAGLKVSIEENSTRSCKYTVVRVGRFVLTASHAAHEKAYVQDAIFRKQHASVNKLIAHPRLPYTEFDAIAIEQAREIFGIILHGTSPFTGTGFLRLVFPSAKSMTYVQNLDIFALHQQMLAANFAAAQTEMVDLAIPTLKQNIKKEANEGR